MNINDQLLKEHSKKQALHIASYINNEHGKFDELVDVFLNGPHRVTQRAAQVLHICVSLKPDLITPYLHLMVYNMQNPVHDAVLRNTLKILQFINLPEELMGITCELCFTFLLGKYPIAIKVFAMQVIFNISEKYPELKSELKIAIEDQMPFGSAGFRSRGSKIIKKIEGKSKR